MAGCSTAMDGVAEVGCGCSMAMDGAEEEGRVAERKKGCAVPRRATRRGLTSSIY